MASSRSTSKPLSRQQREELLATLQDRFEANMRRHNGLAWSDVQARIDAQPDGLWSLHEMERTGGEPDVVALDRKTGAYVFFDCSAETPEERRNVCYDPAALDARKEAKPRDSAVGMAEAMGIQLLTEDDYRALQKLGAFDTKTSSWLNTPPAIRKRGGAIFGDRRYDAVFVYHNGAQSYYAGRGFRGSLRV